MSRVPGRFGVKAVAAAYGAEPRELLAMVRSGQIPAMGAGCVTRRGEAEAEEAGSVGVHPFRHRDQHMIAPLQVSWRFTQRTLPVLLDLTGFTAITIGVWFLAGAWAFIAAGLLLLLAGFRGSVVTGSEKSAAEFVAIVEQVLASMPRVRYAPEDVDAAAADLVRRILAVYPQPQPPIGYRAIIDRYGADSRYAAHARFLNKLHEFGLRYRGQRHRAAASLPAPLVEEPDQDAVGAELVELFRLRHRI